MVAFQDKVYSVWKAVKLSKREDAQWQLSVLLLQGKDFAGCHQA
jgi:hypothetical protein